MKKEEPIVKTVPISELQISEFNVRKERDSDKIAELAKSIEQEGILQPLLVRPENSHYGIIIGSRRFTAAKKANLKQVPVIIKDLEDQESLVVSLVENLQRNDLEPRETTQAMNTLNQTITQEELAIKLGKSHAYISQMVTVCKLLTKLEAAGTDVKMYPKEQETKQKKAIPLYHAVKVAEAFKSPQLKKVLEEQPNKDVDVAKAITNVTQENAIKIIREFKKHPEDNIERIVEQAEMGLLEDEDRGHAIDFHDSLGERGFDISGYEYGINEHSGLLCFYLSDIRKMPEPTDDVEVDFIRKTREFRKTLVSELDPMHRAGIHKRLNYLSALIEETMEEIEKVEKK